MRMSEIIKRKNKSLGYDHFCIEVGFIIFIKIFLYKDYDIYYIINLSYFVCMFR